MSVFRVEKDKNYTCMSNYHFKEKSMTLKAKGLLSLMLSLPDTWDYSIAGLVAICKENETAVKSTLKELQEFGYLEVIKKMPNETKSGRIEYEYIIYEKPKKQEDKKQEVENLDIENQSQLNTKRLNTNNIINNINIINDENNNIDINKQIEEDLEKKKKEAKKAEKVKKVKNAILINQMLEDFTSNLEVQKALKDYLVVRKKKGLTAAQWKLILEDLRKECGTNKDYALEKIQKATAGGWMQIIYSNKSSFRSKPSFDNTANHQVPKGVASMTEEEKDDFYENELAKDENGNYLKF